MHTICLMKCLSEVFFLVWHSFWLSLLYYPFMRLTCVFHYNLVSFCFCFWYILQDMSQVYTDSHGRTRKRTKAEAVAAIERISQRKIVIERGVLRADIRVAPFDFIFRTFQENGWLSLFDVVSSTRTCMLRAYIIIPHVWKLKCAAPHCLSMPRLLLKSPAFHLFMPSAHHS